MRAYPPPGAFPIVAGPSDGGDDQSDLEMLVRGIVEDDDTEGLPDHGLDMDRIQAAYDNAERRQQHVQVMRRSPKNSSQPSPKHKDRVNPTKLNSAAAVFVPQPGATDPPAKSSISDQEEYPECNGEQEAFCMLSSPEQLQALRQQMTKQLMDMEKQKAQLRQECDNLQTELTEKQGLKEAVEKLEQAKIELEKQPDVVAIREAMHRDKEDYIKQVQKMKAEYDKTCSDLEKTHQKSLQELRAQLEERHRNTLEHSVKEAIQEKQKEFNRKVEIVKQEAIESSSKKEKQDAKKIPVLEGQVAQLKQKLEKEIGERKQLQESYNSLQEEVDNMRKDNEGLKRRLQEVRLIERKKREEAVEEVTERYEESLAAATETLPYSSTTYSPVSPTTHSSVASPSSPGNRQNDILRQQQELLERSRRNVSSPVASSSQHEPVQPSIGQDDEAERAIADAKEAESREKRAMETWIRGQCADMGMDFEQLDDEMRQEMENAYRAACSS